MRLSSGAVALGHTPADAPVQVVLGLPWRNDASLTQFVRDLADPQSPDYQRFLSPREFMRRFRPHPADVVAVTRFLHGAGLRVAGISRSRLLITAVGRADDVARALAAELVDVFDAGIRHTVTATRPALPPALGAQVVSVGLGMALRAAQSDGRSAIGLPLDPDGVAELYAFDGLYAAGVAGNASRASTIAIATAVAFDPGELQSFWQAMGVGRSLDSVELIRVAGQAGAPVADRLETTLDVEWATAMAPRAPVLVYAGADATASTFLQVYDRIVSDNRAAVMTTSWGRCEADYPLAYLAQMDALLARAAAQGITVIAASGDQGAFECAGDDTPSVSFPASHPYVLAVGGTSLRLDGTDVGETAWSRSGGGVSGHYAAPAWQMTTDATRALADVALNADPNSGYAVYYQHRWTVFGGTSLAAPIWSALIALANQSRAAAGRPTLGLAAPMLCELALASTLNAAPFIDIATGDNGAFSAGPGYDYPSGWGVPSAASLASALSQWTPPPDGRGGMAQLIPLTPLSPDLAGSARLRFERRCLSTNLDLQVRRLAPGAYTLDVDDRAVASFSPDARGAAMLTLTHVDLRGHHVSISAAGGQMLFNSATVTNAPTEM